MSTPTPLLRLKIVASLLEKLAASDPDAADALADLQAAQQELLALGFDRMNPSAPSHVSKVQAARALKVSRQAIVNRIRRGTMPTELHYGEAMIPMFAVVQALAKKENQWVRTPS